MKTNNFFIIISALILASCLKIDEASVIPEIKLTSQKNYKGTDELENLVMQIAFTFSFTDGDGDLTDSDPKVHNLFITPYRRKFKEVHDTLNVQSYSIPYVESAKTVRIMKGEIECTYNMTLNLGYNLNDTILFDIYVQDRAGHQSNIVRSKDFIFAD